MRAFTFRADDELVDAIDRARGLVPRVTWMRAALRRVPEIARELDETQMAGHAKSAPVASDQVGRGRPESGIRNTLVTGTSVSRRASEVAMDRQRKLNKAKEAKR